ncbi:MAG: hypothetical protein KBT34_04980 [Prevotella sp.]|nr:hypothetical protein [Candidatus Prevotella equi]
MIIHIYIPFISFLINGQQETTSWILLPCITIRDGTATLSLYTFRKYQTDFTLIYSFKATLSCFYIWTFYATCYITTRDGLAERL